MIFKIKREIPFRSRFCSLGKEEFLPGAEYQSVLIRGMEGGYERKDYCSVCKEKLPDEQKSIGNIRWKSSVPQKKSQPPASIGRRERALALLKEILDDKNEGESAQAYLLALWLIRMKTLVLKKEFSAEEGDQILLCEIAETEEILGIRKIPLSSDAIATLQPQLAAKLAEIIVRP